jgi:hypothetical protein
VSFLAETSVGNGYSKLFRANINTEKDFTKTNIHASSSTVTDGCECAHFAPKPAYRFIYKYKKAKLLKLKQCFERTTVVCCAQLPPYYWKLSKFGSGSVMLHLILHCIAKTEFG